jgi:hypothetical protein
MRCAKCERVLHLTLGAVIVCDMPEGCILRPQPYTSERFKMSDPTDALLQERAKTHGDFTRHAEITQKLKLVFFDNKEPTLTYAQCEAVDMIFHKLGRIGAGDPNFRDHWDDIAGYARLVAERCPK